MRENDFLRIDRDLLEKFARAIAERTGLSIRQQDWERLRGKITLRVCELQLHTAQEYYFLLEAVNTRPSLLEVYRSEREWKTLINSLTVTESYFFRDLGQFNLLRDRILPQIIEKKKHDQSGGFGGSKPSLKIWSAACSSGEEPYSIAIVLKECVPDIEDWEISIIGTDINEEVLEQAKKGLYSSWSFRPIELNIQQRYFKPFEKQWKLDENIRNMVKFDRVNLVRDRFPNSLKGLEEFDLILCRNVFIYFENRAISEVLSKFYQTLRSGGYLMAAHGELQGQSLDRFQTHSFCESVLYQRPPEDNQKRSLTRVSLLLHDRNTEEREIYNCPQPPNFSTHSSIDLHLPKISPQRQQKEVTPISNRYVDPDFLTVSQTKSLPQTDVSQLFCEAALLFKNQSYTATIQKIEQLLPLQPNHLEAYTLIAQAYANLGDYQKAAYYCVQALGIDSLYLKIYYLLAQISEIQGNPQKAKTLLKQIIYLDPKSADAYLELSYLYQKEGKIEKSRKMKQNAIDLIERVPQKRNTQIQVRVENR
jgi:chemotaxis protein methyltransferase CheR